MKNRILKTILIALVALPFMAFADEPQPQAPSEPDG